MNAPAPLISVVIPAYNAEQWIGEALESVFSQDYPNMEIIVVDDGSTDSTAEVIQNNFPGAALIRTTNGGPSRARNIGWRRAKGEWIQFLDADDILHPHKISLQSRYAESASPATAVIYSPWQRIAYQQDNSWMPIGEILRPNITDPITDLLKSENFIQLASALIRRDFLARAEGFDETRWLVEDVQLELKIAGLGGEFINAPSNTPLFFYRQSCSSLSHKNAIAFSQACLNNAILAEQLLTKTTSAMSTPKEGLIAAYQFVARSSFTNDPQTFEAALQALKRLSPNNRYIPKTPRSLRITSAIFGYRRAEAIAAVYRKIKPLFQRSSNQ